MKSERGATRGDRASATYKEALHQCDGVPLISGDLAVLALYERGCELRISSIMPYSFAC